MITNRINIINQDLSTSLPQADTSVKGFIVVAAEKGPINPVYIPAGSTALVHEYIGYPTATYNTVQDVLDFNAEFGVYVSAPYDAATASVPVAYITPAGIFSRSASVPLHGVAVETIGEDGVTVSDITSVSSAQDVLVPVGNPDTLFGVGSNVTSQISYSSGATSTIGINVGFDARTASPGEFSQIDVTDIQYISSATTNVTTGRVMKAVNGTLSAVQYDAVLVFDIPGEDLIRVYVKKATGTITLYCSDEKVIATIDSDGATALESLTIDSGDATNNVSDATYAKYFSPTAITNTWASATFRASVRVYWEAEVNEAAIYGSIFQKYASARETTLTFPKQVLGNKISFTASELSTPISSTTRTIYGSLVDSDIDGFGASLSFKEVLANQGLIQIYPIKEFSSSTVYTKTGVASAPTVTMAAVKLSRGVRPVDDTALAAGWTAAAGTDYSSVDIFMEPKQIGSGLVPYDPTAFLSLAGTHDLSRFIASQLIAPADIDEDTTQLSYGHNYFIITNAFVRKSSYTREDFTNYVVGAYGKMIARGLVQKLGGFAPMYLNAGSLGGQLGVVAKKAQYKFTKEQLGYLDAANYNPVDRDTTYGVLVKSQKTAKGGEASDWSYIGHTSAFLAFQREIWNNVMIPQIGKPNNPFYRQLRASQANALSRSRTEGANRIWASVEVDTESVNDAETLAQRQFKIAIKVKVDIFSEGVTLIFTNLPQTA